MTDPDRIAHELRRLASQENCDGEPYDTMQQAAQALDTLHAELAKLKDADAGYELAMNDLKSEIGRSRQLEAELAAVVRLLTEWVVYHEKLPRSDGYTEGEIEAATVDELKNTYGKSWRYLKRPNSAARALLDELVQEQHQSKVYRVELGNQCQARSVAEGELARVKAKELDTFQKLKDCGTAHKDALVRIQLLEAELDPATSEEAKELTNLLRKGIEALPEGEQQARQKLVELTLKHFLLKAYTTALRGALDSIQREAQHGEPNGFKEWVVNVAQAALRQGGKERGDE